MLSPFIAAILIQKGDVSLPFGRYQLKDLIARFHPRETLRMDKKVENREAFFRVGKATLDEMDRLMASAYDVNIEHRLGRFYVEPDKKTVDRERVWIQALNLEFKVQLSQKAQMHSRDATKMTRGKSPNPYFDHVFEERIRETSATSAIWDLASLNFSQTSSIANMIEVAEITASYTAQQMRAWGFPRVDPDTGPQGDFSHGCTVVGRVYQGVDDIRFGLQCLEGRAVNSPNSFANSSLTCTFPEVVRTSLFPEDLVFTTFNGYRFEPTWGRKKVLPESAQVWWQSKREGAKALAESMDGKVTLEDLTNSTEVNLDTAVTDWASNTDCDFASPIDKINDRINLRQFGKTPKVFGDFFGQDNSHWYVEKVGNAWVFKPFMGFVTRARENLPSQLQALDAAIPRN